MERLRSPFLERLILFARLPEDGTHVDPGVRDSFHLPEQCSAWGRVIHGSLASPHAMWWLVCWHLPPEQHSELLAFHNLARQTVQVSFCSVKHAPVCPWLRIQLFTKVLPRASPTLNKTPRLHQGHGCFTCCVQPCPPVHRTACVLALFAACKYPSHETDH